MLCGVSARASQEDVPVLHRTQSAYDAAGIRSGGLILSPSVTLMESFDSNIYASTNTAKSDFITQIQPGLTFHTSNKQKGFKGILTADYGLYKNLSRENFSDYKAVFNPYWNVTHNWTLKADLSWEKDHERRNDPDALQNNASVEPVTYQRTAALVGATFKPGLMSFGLHAGRAYLDYDNGQSMAGTRLVNDDRNRFENTVTADISCALTDRTTLSWATQWLTREYKRADFVGTSYSGDERDSNVYQSTLGITLPLTPLITLNAQAGYRYQAFDDGDYDTIGTGIGKVGITWMVTPLTTITIGGYRDAFETNQADASGYVQTQAETVIAHELRRNIILHLRGGMGTNDYIGIDRDDDYWTAGAGAIYKMNGWLHWQVAYAYEERNSNIPVADYSKQRVFLSTKVQF